MPIIRQTIRYIPVFGTGLTTNIKFGLVAEDAFLGLQQEIDNLTQNTSQELINPAVDVEERKFAYDMSSGTLKLEFNFHIPGLGNEYGTKFEHLGFTQDEIKYKSSSILNSFFILDFYDTYDINTQNKIFTTYLTKVTNGNSDGTEAIAEYTVGDSNNPNQLYYWYVPVTFLTGTTLNGYVKFSFFNAKSGKIISLYNFDNESLISSLKMFFSAVINVTNRTWNIFTPATHSKVVVARQLWDSPAFTDKVDKTVENINNESQNYPKGSTFNYTNGKYLTPAGLPAVQAPIITTTTTTETPVTVIRRKPPITPVDGVNPV